LCGCLGFCSCQQGISVAGTGGLFHRESRRAGLVNDYGVCVFQKVSAGRFFRAFVERTEKTGALGLPLRIAGFLEDLEEKNLHRGFAARVAGVSDSDGTWKTDCRMSMSSVSLSLSSGERTYGNWRSLKPDGGKKCPFGIFYLQGIPNRSRLSSYVKR
jgi:hypothetical protein